MCDGLLYYWESPNLCTYQFGPILSLDLPPLDHLPAKVVMDLKSIAQYLISAPGESHTGGQHKNKRHEWVKENWLDL